MYLSAYKLVVSAEADSKDMTLLETVKTELGITVTTYDTLLATLIQQVSAAIVAYCNREFAEETVIESFRPLWCASAVEALILARVPATDIDTVVEDGTTLDSDEYEVDPATGFLWKLSGADRVCWSGRLIVVTYTGGYQMLDTLPQDLERACIDLVKHHWSARQRDPALKSLAVDGVATEQYGFGNVNDDGLPMGVAPILDGYRRIVI